MQRKNILKIAIITTVVTFNVISYNKTIKQQKEIRHQKAINFKYKTDKEIYKEWHGIYIKAVKEKEAKELAEKQKVEELKKQKEESEWINLVCTFYTGSEDENGGTQNANKTASGKILSRGMCASNAHKFGTRIYTKEFGILEVQDTGNPKYIHQIDENTYRIDIYVPDKITANKLGVIKIKGKIIK